MPPGPELLHERHINVENCLGSKPLSVTPD